MKKHNETITEKTQISPNKADSILLQQYSFENLVVGEHNKFAFAAAKAAFAAVCRLRAVALPPWEPAILLASRVSFHLS